MLLSLAFNTFKFFSADISLGISVNLLFCKFSTVVLSLIGAGKTVKSYPEQSTMKSSPSMRQTHGLGHRSSPSGVGPAPNSSRNVFGSKCSIGGGGAASVGLTTDSSGSSITPNPLPSITSEFLSGGNWLSFSTGICSSSSLWAAAEPILKKFFIHWKLVTISIRTLSLKQWRSSLIGKR